MVWDLQEFGNATNLFADDGWYGVILLSFGSQIEEKTAVTWIFIALEMDANGIINVSWCFAYSDTSGKKITISAEMS